MKNPNSTRDKLMSIKKTKEFVKAIEGMGYRKVSQSGSHMKFCCGNTSVIIPDTREFAPGTRRGVVKQICGDGYN